jgi:hypothetical protein
LGRFDHLANRSFFIDLDDATFDTAQGIWQGMPLHETDDEWFRGMELPTEAVRLPLPFAVLCSRGIWNTFCVCELGGETGDRGGWRIGRFRSAQVAAVASGSKLGKTRIPRLIA